MFRLFSNNTNLDNLYKSILSKNGTYLQHIYEDLQTKELCLTAIEADPEAYYYTRDDLRKDEDILVKYCSSVDDGLINIKPELQTHKICIAAIDRNPLMIRYARDDLMSEAIIDAFNSRRHGSILDYHDPPVYSPGDTDDELIEKLNEYHMFLRDIPYERQNENICMEAVDINPYQILFVRPDLQTKTMALLALTHGDPVLRYIRSDIRDLEIIKFAAQKNVDNLHGIRLYI